MPLSRATGGGTNEEAGADDRKSYETPVLVEYGSIAKLTQGNATVANDSIVGRLMMQCL